MKVLFDSQIFDWQINGGISRYFVEVLGRLNKTEDVKVLLNVKHSYNTYIQQSPWLRNAPVLKGLHFKGKLGALKLINQKINRSFSNRLLKKGVPDIFHPTYYDPYFLRYLKNMPLVLTVYDLTNEKINDKSELTTKMLAWKRRLIDAAGHIISISENTKKDIVEYYKISPQKITTIPLAGGFEKSAVEAVTFIRPKEIPGNYILFVGSRSHYKNFQEFVKEVAPVMIKEDIHLVAAGGGPMNTSEFSLLKELNIDSRITAYPHVSDNQLAGLYNGALVFVFPSLYEGFGLPVLEAMQCKCPALLSNNSSLPEVGGNAAVYFDPFQKGSLQNQLIRTLADEALRKRMIGLGLEQIRKFNWDITAQAHVAVYKKMVQ